MSHQLAVSPLLSEIQTILHQEQPTGSRHGLLLLRFSLTVPNFNGQVRQAGRSLASEVQALGGSCILFADVSKKGVEHLYGLALTDQPAHHWRRRWMCISGASAKGTNIIHTWYKAHSWSRGASVDFEKSLRNVLTYALKTLPPRHFGMTIDNRLIATTGQFAQAWSSARAALVWAFGVVARPCQGPGCTKTATGGPLNKYCHPSCRTRRYRRRVGQVAAGLQVLDRSFGPIAAEWAIEFSYLASRVGSQYARMVTVIGPGENDLRWLFYAILNPSVHTATSAIAADPHLVPRALKVAFRGRVGRTVWNDPTGPWEFYTSGTSRTVSEAMETLEDVHTLHDRL